MPEQTWQPAEGVAVDTYIREDGVAINYGGQAILLVGYANNNVNYDVLMRWDLTAIPKGSTIEAATLSLRCNGPVVGGLQEITIRRILPGNLGWTEMGCTWNTQDGANPWVGGAGCEVLGTDIANTLMWGPTTWVPVAGVWDTFDLNVQEFQYLIDIGNYGFKIGSERRIGADPQRFTDYDSAAAVAGANRPTLYVRWIEPSGRLVEYTFDVWDPLQRIIARDGHEVPPNEVRSDRWGKLLGFRSPSSKVFASLTDGPDHYYISGVTSDGEMVRIIPDETLFADMILKRLTR